MDPITMAAIASAGANIFGSVMGSRSTAQSTRDTNDSNAQIARENRDWQERMDNTKYQRGVNDARLAGFNPLVAFPGSAGTPTPATPTMQNPNPNKGELFLSTAKALNDIILTREMAKTERTKQELNNAETDTKRGGVNAGFFRTTLSDIAKKLAPTNTAKSNKDLNDASHNRARSHMQQMEKNSYLAGPAGLFGTRPK